MNFFAIVLVLLVVHYGLIGRHIADPVAQTKLDGPSNFTSPHSHASLPTNHSVLYSLPFSPAVFVEAPADPLIEHNRTRTGAMDRFPQEISPTCETALKLLTPLLAPMIIGPFHLMVSGLFILACSFLWTNSDQNVAPHGFLKFASLFANALLAQCIMFLLKENGLQCSHPRSYMQMVCYVIGRAHIMFLPLTRFLELMLFSIMAWTALQGDQKFYREFMVPLILINCILVLDCTPLIALGPR